MKLPKGCFNFINHERILRKDINCTRPLDQCKINTERAIRHGFKVVKHTRLFRKSYWKALSFTTYEMSGVYCRRYMGGRTWAETDLTGLEFHFHTEGDAEKFAYS